MLRPLYTTSYGEYYIESCEDFIKKSNLSGKVQLILTSPPFPLNRKKKYGNLTGDEYRQWFTGLAPLLSDLLTDDGSIVIEMGNSWEKGRPVQSLLHLQSLLGFVENPDTDLRLCQEFICHNPARLPSPAQWVTIEKIRAVDSFTHVWWIAKNDKPKADNRKILRPYSKSMKDLLKRKKYNSGTRPSGHSVSDTGFLNKHDGSISHNVVEMPKDNISEDEMNNLRLPFSMIRTANTKSNDFYIRTCKQSNITPHPARMPIELASYFIEFLTDKGDIVFDPFAGSNVTGFCAEIAQRKWLSTDIDQDFGKQSVIRFKDPVLKTRIKMGG